MLHLPRIGNIKMPLCLVLSYTKAIYCTSATKEENWTEQGTTRVREKQSSGLDNFLSLFQTKIKLVSYFQTKGEMRKVFLMNVYPCAKTEV